MLKAKCLDFLSGNHLSGYDGMQIYITGNENRIQLSSVFDNLGKGASGAAIQCFNIMTGCDEAKGLKSLKQRIQKRERIYLCHFAISQKLL